MVKLEKILESMDSFKLHSEVALLENEGLTDLVRAQTRKELHENFNFIKKSLIQDGLLEETQSMLANTWTQAIMEDIEMPYMEDIKDFGNKVAGGAQGLGHGIAGTAGLLSGAAQGGNLENIKYENLPGAIGKITQAGYERGYDPNANVGDTYGATEFIGENPNLTAAGLVGGAGLAGLATVGTMKAAPKVVNAMQSAPKEIKTGYKMASSSAGLENSIMKHGNAASKLGASVGGTVRRAKKLF